ncbi:MAG: type II toxin-antitoxin system MqsR family toxin [Candidatus Korobacteraceae bacterium]
MRAHYPGDGSRNSRVSKTARPGAPAGISSLSRRNFYKSMTTYADHRVWQDVYHADTPVKKQAYIKITLRDMAPVIQFKER